MPLARFDPWEISMNAKPALVLLVTLPLLLLGSPATPKAPEVIPHGQDQLPGPPLSPQQAIKKMTVPEGFSVELVASEPDIVNPVAMTFDERGRIWITESLEYPRAQAGPGRDRIKVLESTRGDGKYDRITVFAEGLNIPSGIAVGNGGVYVANSPDLLFLRDTHGKGKADHKEVLVTGFGRFDTHELPNSLTWGPDGWLYGLNGVFNPAHVKHQGKEFDFTCALFRLHPRTHEFQLFAEGTSNPWGIAWDTEGSAFVSACVIDHLWHLAETGYYIRQGGPYPPFTWPQGSIVNHKHQKAAYCGLHFFDSDAYPPEYRERLYMGNIHGSCINVDVLRRDGSTYAARTAPDFLRANDPWFMPVVQKTGPDGCLYILDWYDRYHCYQDAQRDPRGIDRLRGRLYRVRYKGYRPAGKFDLGKETDDQLIGRLSSPNVYFRDQAQRLLRERNRPATRKKLQKLVLDDQVPRKARMHALWVLVGTGSLDSRFHQKLLAHRDPAYRAWAVRVAGNFGKVDDAIRSRVLHMADDPSPDVKLQVAIAARKLDQVDPLPILVNVLYGCGDDPLIPHIIWQNLHPLLEDRADEFLRLVADHHREKGYNATVLRLLARVTERILGRRRFDVKTLETLFAMLTVGPFSNPEAARACMATLTSRIHNGEIQSRSLQALADRLRPRLEHLMSIKSSGDFFLDSHLLAATLRDPKAIEFIRREFTEGRQNDAIRLKELEVLVFLKAPTVLRSLSAVLDPKANSVPFRSQVLAILGRLDDARVARVVLATYPRMELELQPRAVELLTQRTAWSKDLLRAIGQKKVSADALNVNQVRKLLAGKDPDLVKQVRANWGTIRTQRNPEREQVVARMRDYLRTHRGDPAAGARVFKNLCAQCHKIYGEGTDVGPDITVNGRGSFEQLLSNVFDPSLVIGAAYQATTVTTTRGRFLIGLVVEDSKQRVVLKVQGGKLETIPRGEIESIDVSQLSMMPEDLEKQLKAREIADLFAFLCLDRPPGDPRARKIPGAP
jgi:putative heme-binding domain-containing protein